MELKNIEKEKELIYEMGDRFILFKSAEMRTVCNLVDYINTRSRYDCCNSIHIVNNGSYLVHCNDVIIAKAFIRIYANHYKMAICEQKSR